MKKRSFCLDIGIYKLFPKSDLIIILSLLILLVTTVIYTLYELNKFYLIEKPINGGILNIGTITVPIHKNPLYANNMSENDIAYLLHAGLLKKDNKNNLIPNLAETWKKENDITHIFKIKENAIFHDGTPITSKDISKTIEVIKQIENESNYYYSSWKDSKIEIIDNKTVKITVGNLNFPEAFTTPIIPEHVWKKIPVKNVQNYKGSGVYIGAGPYKFKKEIFNIDERPTKLTLTPFNNYVLGKPHIEIINLHFFFSIKDLLIAYKEKEINSIHGISAVELETLLRENKEVSVRINPTNRVIGIFFNTKNEILSDPFLRSILGKYINKEKIVKGILNEKAEKISGLISTEVDKKGNDITLEELYQTLEDIGWGFNGSTGKREKDGVEFKIKIEYPKTEETRNIAELIAKNWRELGVTVTTSPIQENETYDVLIHGYTASNEKDLIKIWKNDDKNSIKNITNYQSETLDKLFEDFDIKLNDVKTERDKLLKTVYNEIKIEMVNNVPAVLIYSPQFLHLLPKGITEIKQEKVIHIIDKPSDRFSNIHNWHIKREKIWKFLVDSN